MEQHSQKSRARSTAGAFIAVAETYALAEMMWILLNPSAPRLYEYGVGYFWEVREQLTYRVQVISTLRSIQRLPE